MSGDRIKALAASCVVAAAPVLLLYLLCVFVTLQPDPRLWSEGGRAGFAWFVTLPVLFAVVTHGERLDRLVLVAAAKDGIAALEAARLRLVRQRDVDTGAVQQVTAARARLLRALGDRQ